mgnify:FL=1
MKKKKFKRLEFLMSLGVQMMGQAVEMKKLQIEEMKLKAEKNDLNSISGVVEIKKGNPIFDVLSKILKPENRPPFASGGMMNGDDLKEFVAPKFGSKLCECPVCEAERRAKNGD